MQPRLSHLEFEHSWDPNLPIQLGWIWGADGATRGEVNAWCNENFGSESSRWCGLLNGGAIQFRDEKDAMLFLLKWA